jgi:nitrogen fixation-related uncharacterized protein
MTIGAAIVLIAIGAVLKWAVTAHVNGFDIQTAGMVVFIVGLVGLGLAILYTFLWSRDERYDRYDTVARRPPPGAPPPAV